MYKWFFFGFKNIWDNRFRNILALLAISISVALILAIQIANNSIDSSIKAKVDEMFGKADIIVTVPERSNLVITTEEINKVIDMKSVKDVILSVNGFLTSSYNSSFKLIGVDTKKSRLVQGFDLISGSWFTNKNKREIIISSKYSKETKLEVGDIIKLSNGNFYYDFTVSGIVSEMGAGQQLTKASGIVSLETGREVFQIESGANTMYILLDNNNSITLNEIEKLFPLYKVTDKTTQYASLKTGLNDLKVGLLFLTIICTILSASIIFSSFSVRISERTREFGTFRAIGADKAKILSIVLIEGFVLGILGIILGLALGIFLGFFFINIFSTSSGSSDVIFKIPSNGVLLSIIIGILTTIISTLYPAYHASKNGPIEAFFQANLMIDKPKERTPIKSFVIGIVLVSISIYSWFKVGDFDNQSNLLLILLLSFIGFIILLPAIIKPLLLIISNILNYIFGFTGKIAALNLLRTKKRTTTIIIMVTIAISTVVSINIITYTIKNEFISKFIKNFNIDLTISSSESNKPLIESSINRISEIEGIDIFTPVNMIFIHNKALDRNIRYNGVIMDKYYQMIDFDVPKGFKQPDYEKLNFGEAVAISEKIAIQLKIDVGDEYILKTSKEEYKLPIAAVYEEVEAGGYTIYLPLEIYDKIFNPYGRSMYFIKVKKGVSTNNIKENLEDTEWGKDLSILSFEDNKNRIKSIFMSLFMPFNAVNIISVIIALFGVMNSLLLSIYERKKELSILRSLGAERRRIWLYIITEAGVIGLIGVLFGYPLGITYGTLTSYSLNLTSQNTLFIHIPIKFLFISMFSVIGLTMLTSLFPAIKATKGEIADNFLV